MPRHTRRTMVPVLVALVAAGGLTCTDGPTAPGRGGGPVLLHVAPSFSVADAAAFDALNAFGVSVNNIHIHIDHPPAAAFDTVVSVTPGSDSVVLALPVVLNSATETLNVQIELRNGSQVLFSGTQSVVATAGARPEGPVASVPIVYVGPGAAAVALTIAPRDTVIRTSGVVQYQASARDAGGNPVTGLTVAWSVADPTLGSIDASGAFTASGREGSTRISALTLNGLRDSVGLVITAPPSRIAVVSGDAQTGVAGAALTQPLVVQVQTASGTPVPGVAITFSAPATGAVSPATAISDGNGRAQAVMTLGHATGAQAFGANAPGLSGAGVTATAVAGPAAVLAKVSGDAQADSVGALLPLPFTVKATDQFGNPAAGAMVDWTRVAGGGTLSAATSTSGADGVANVSYTLGSVIRTDTISAALHGVSGASVLFTAVSRARNPRAIAKLSGDAQTAAVATTLANPLVVLVSDANGQPVPGVTVGWSVVGGGGAVNPASSTTDSLGHAATVLTLGPATGFNTVTATVGTTLSTTFTLTGTAGAASVMTKSAGDAQTAAAGAAVAVKPAVTITDSHGNPVAGASVSFAVSAGGGSATGVNTTTSATGVATVGGWTLGTAGAQTLTATSGTLSAVFTATVAGSPPANITTQLNTHLDTLTALGDTYTLTAQARDSTNTAVSGTFA